MIHLYIFLVLFLVIAVVSVKQMKSISQEKNKHLIGLMLNHVEEKRKNIDNHIIQNAMIQHDLQSMYQLFTQGNGFPILKKSVVEKIANGTSDPELRGQVMLEISKSQLDFIDKLVIMSYHPIHQYNEKEAYEDMKAFLNILELSQFMGLEVQAKNMFHSGNLQVIEQWSKQKDHILCYHAATQLLKFFNK